MWVAAFAIICVAIIWHVIHWHSTGMYVEMFSWTKTGRVYLTVLYNLGLMGLWGVGLGLLMEKITDLLGHEFPETKHFDNGDITRG